jgi:hypothetical protein
MAITKATASSIAPAAKGNLVVGSATNDAGVLAVGTDTHILVADSAESLGMKWAAPAAGGGKVLQVVQGTLTSTFSTTGTAPIDTGLEVSITPSSATSKVMILVGGFVTAARSGSQTNATSEWTLLVSSTQLQRVNLNIYLATTTSPEINGALNFSYLDSPNISTIYKDSAVI